MDLGIVERLICPEPHAVMPLVVRADAVEHGRLVRGMLGCPHCHMEWVVTDGIARFGARADIAAVAAEDPATLAALLGLSEPMLVLTDGASARLVDALSREFDASVVVLDAADPPPSATVIHGAKRVPIGAGTVGAALLLRPGRDADFVASAARALAPAGRLVATASVPVSGELREIARDNTWWVATREHREAPITLRRRDV
jgi:hypothetical protein